MVKVAIPLFVVLAVVVTIGTSGVAYAGTTIDPSDLSDYRVVTVEGYAVEAWLDENLPGVTYTSVPTALDALRMLNNGMADVYLDPLATANYLARQHDDLAPLQSAGPLGDDYALSIAYTEGDQTLGSIMQELIDSTADQRLALLEGLANPPSFTAEEQAWLDANPTITVAYDPSWPPYEYAGSSDNLLGASGAFVAMFSALSGSEFLEAENVEDWGDALDRMRAGTADVMFTIENTAERDTYMDFTDVWLRIDIDLLVADDGLDVTVSNLADYRVVTVDGYAVETWLDDNLPGVTYTSVPTALDALRMLYNDTADVYLDPLATANYLAVQNGLAPLHDKGPLGDDYALSIAYTEGDEILGSIMQKLIGNTADGQQALFENLPTPQFTPEELRWLGTHPTITVAYDPSWPPYEYAGSSDNLLGASGAFVAMFSALSGSEFLEAENVEDWGDALDRMRTGTADVMFTIEDTTERDTYMDFTDPWLRIDIDILTLADPPVLVCR